MNAERLNAVCIEIAAALKSTQILGHLQALVAALQNLFSQPQASAHQQQVSVRLDTLLKALENFPTDTFSPAWNNLLDEIGGSELLGLRLRNKILSIIEHNRITPATAHKEVINIFQQLQEFSNAINGIVSGLERLRIGSEKLNPGESEVGILIPRVIFEGDIRKLGEEFQEIDFLIAIFAEISTGKREPYKITTLSSSEFMVFLGAAAPVIACIAFAVEKLIDNYKKLLEIRNLRNRLKEQGVPDTDTKGISKYATNLMATSVEKITIEVMAEYYSKKDDPGRKNELSNALSIALSKIANRIDQGYSIEVRTEPLAPAPTAKESSQDDVSKYIHTIQTSYASLRFIRPAGERILELPENKMQPKP